MPRLCFSPESEKRLIELWAEYQRTKAGTMVKRYIKEKEIADKLSAFERELVGEGGTVYTAAMVRQSENKSEGALQKNQEDD